jgi:hypothetical protein
MRIAEKRVSNELRVEENIQSPFLCNKVAESLLPVSVSGCHPMLSPTRRRGKATTNLAVNPSAGQNLSQGSWAGEAAQPANAGISLV